VSVKPYVTVGNESTVNEQQQAQSVLIHKLTSTMVDPTLEEIQPTSSTLEHSLSNQPLQHGIFPALTAWCNQPLQHSLMAMPPLSLDISTQYYNVCFSS